MTVRTVLVCEAQVPFVHGGAEVHVRRARAGAAAARVPGRARERAVQVVSERRNPAARGGVAAARSQREQRPPDRSGDRVEVPVVLRAASEQGRLADPPVPRRLRAVRHGVQRLRAHRARRRAARHADAARHGDARRVPRASSATRGTRRRGSRSSTASRPSRCIIRRGWRRGSSPVRTATTCCRSAASSRSSAWICIVKAMAGVRPANPPRRRGRRHAAAERRAAAAEGGRRGSRHVSRHGGRRRADRALCRRAGRRLPAVRRGLRLRDARGVPRRGSR